MAGEKDGKNEHAQAMAALGASKGGLARAEAMTPERRREVAQKAALARWGTNLPRETHQGILAIGGAEIQCFVLDNNQRVLSTAGLARAFGSRKKGRNVTAEDAPQIPPFLASPGINSCISDDLRVAINAPLLFRTKSGLPGVGWEATLIPKMCEAILDARAQELLTTRQKPVAVMAETLLRGLASTGIIALVDEATGYQADRGRDALAKILERFIAKELSKWVRTFPPDFYKEIFRLNDWPYTPDSVKRPGVIAHYTKDVVYARLAPGVLEELKRVTPKNDAGRPKAKLFQSLTEDLGHPRLREHLSAVVALMKISKNWAGFTRHLDAVFPRFGDTLSMYPPDMDG
jgi:hypothetical protein